MSHQSDKSTNGRAEVSDPFTSGVREGDPYKLYLVSNSAVKSEFNLSPFKIPIEAIDFRQAKFDYGHRAFEVAQLISLFRSAHALNSAQPRIVLARWMIVDMVLMPSGLLLAVAGQAHLVSEVRRMERTGLSAKAASLRDLLQIASNSHYDGPIPVAGYAAIPTPKRDRWVSGSLWWSLIPDEKLGYTVRRVALESYGAKVEVGVAQFDNLPALGAQRKFGRLLITNADLSVHPVRHTFCYEVDIADLPAHGLPSQCSELLQPARVIDSALQREISAGARYYLRAPARDQVDYQPVAYQDAHGSHDAAGNQASGGDKANSGQTTASPITPDAAVGNVQERPFFTDGIKDGDPYQLCVVSNSRVLADLELSPFDICLDPVDLSDDEFQFRGDSYELPKLLDFFGHANSLSYAESGLGIPEWAMIELALMPSAVLLVLASQDHLTEAAQRLAAEPVTDLRRTRLIPLAEDVRDRLYSAAALRGLLDMAQDLDYAGPLPIAGYGAVPTPRDGYWIGWSMWSLVPGQKLGYTVKRIALACYGVKTLAGVTQFNRARGLDVNAKFGQLRITCAAFPSGAPPAPPYGVHPAPHTFTYEVDVSNLPSDGSPVKDSALPLRPLTLDPQHPNFSNDLEKLQTEMNQGVEYYVVSRSIANVKSPLIPVYRKPASRKWRRP